MAVKARAQITLTVQIDIQSVWWYYKLQSSTAAKPARPTANPPSGWTLTEPSYTEASTNTLYFVELTVFTDGSFQYSDVSVDSSYEAAKAAWNKANAAQSAANNAQNKIDDLQLGGRNYVKDTQGTWSEWITPGTGTNKCYTFAEIDYADMNLAVGDAVAAQVEIEGQGFTQCTRFVAQGSVNNSWSSGDAYFVHPWYCVFDLRSDLTKINSANRYTKVMTFSQSIVDKIKTYGGVATLGIRIDNANAEARYRYRCIKIEKGSRATDWTPAPEDYADALETELKLADVSAQINVASDSIRQEVKADYTAAADNIAALDRRLETLSTQSENNFSWTVTQIDTLGSNLSSATEATEEQLRLIQTYMTFSQDGLTIGKTGNPFTFRVVNDRLAFFMNNTEVAYLSNNKLYVTHAEILTSMMIGKFAFVPQTNGNLSLIFTG